MFWYDPPHSLAPVYKENKSDFLSSMNKDDDTLTFIL
jgi:hypothetical protein